MKRFYTHVTVAPAGAGFAVLLDGRAMKTQAGNPQILPTEALAQLLAAEWADQGATLDPARFVGRDLADYAIDVVALEPAALVAKLLAYAETDTLCYRADPDDPFWRRQQAVWEPLVADTETREGIRLERVSGVMHRPLEPETVDSLRARLATLDPFTLAALENLTALVASVCVGLAALEPDADADTLWNAANLEEDWQAERWGEDAEAAERRSNRRASFLAAMAFGSVAASQPARRVDGGVSDLRSQEHS